MSEEIGKEAEIEQLRREVERGKMEISKLNKLLEQYQEGEGRSVTLGGPPSVEVTTLAHVAIPAAGGLGVAETGGGDRGTGVTTPEKLSGEEWDEEVQLRRAKKKFVIIKGLTLVTKEKKEELEGWMRNIMQIKARVNKLERITGGWRVEFEEWKAKLKLMKEKTILRDLGWGVWITDDLTERQGEVQAWLEKEAEAWRSKGKKARTGYQRLWVDDVCLEWDELEGELKLRKEREEGSFFRDKGRGSSER